MTEAFFENLLINLPNFSGLVLAIIVLWRQNVRLMDSLEKELEDARKIVQDRVHNLEALISERTVTRPVLTDEVNRERLRREFERQHGPLE